MSKILQLKKLPHSELDLEIEVPTDEWEDFLNEAARELSRGLKIPGFRPGCAPRNIVERQLDSGKILERGSELAVRKSYVRLILENKIDALAPPQITILKIAPANPFIFRAQVVVSPEVGLPDYQKIVKKNRPKPKEAIVVSDEEVKESLEWLRKSRAKHITVKRPAQLGDRVEIDFETTVQGAPIPNGASKNHPFILGQGRFVKGFEENLADMKEGEEKNFSLVFPSDYFQKDLADQLVDFKVKMNLVQEQELPQLDDDFAQSAGDFQNLEKLRQSIKDGLLLEKTETEKSKWFQEIIDKIAEDSIIDIPEILIQRELKGMLAETKARLKQFNMDWASYLQEAKKTEEELQNDWRAQSEQRVKFALILKTVAEKEKIVVTPEELEEEMSKAFKQYGPAGENLDIERLKDYTYGVLRNQKVFHFLESIN